MQELVEKMKDSVDKPIRLCVSNIGTALGLRALLECHMDKLPATKDYIESVIEMKMDFRARRVRLAVEVLVEEGQEPKGWRVMRKAGIRYDFYKKVQETIPEKHNR